MGKKSDLIKNLKSFKETLSKEKKIEKIILFGSRATGKARKDSDVDLIIVSPLFRGVKYGRSIGFRRYWNLPYPVDFLCYTPEEFKKLSKGITIVKQALKEGIEII